MKTEILTGNVAKLHETAAQILATNFMLSIQRDTENRLFTLEAMAEAQWLNISTAARACRPDLSGKIIFRKRHVIARARHEIVQRLKANQDLSTKLAAIRKAQADKLQAEIEAVQAAYVPFSFA